MPDTLSVNDEVLGGQKNQQFRIDVMKPEAPLESLDPADVLRTVFATKPGDPLSMTPTRVTANLSAFAGQTVRLRIANAVHRGSLQRGGRRGLDLSVRPAGQAPPVQGGGSKHGPACSASTRSGQTGETGTATLRVRVSGPGLLRAKGDRDLGGRRRREQSGRLRKPIEPVTVPVASARTVTIHLRPTPRGPGDPERTDTGSGQRWAVTFMPVGAASETASVPVMFELEPFLLGALVREIFDPGRWIFIQKI